MSATQSSFYVTGGTLQRDAPSYVPRRADEDLYEGLRAGNFCYVLTSRQMGKSSLMVRTAARLRAEGASVAVLDLTAIGQNLTAAQWYDGLLGRLGRQLDLEDELEDFWEDNERVAPLQRWMRALLEIALPQVKQSLVIFIDEIDAVRSLPFSSDEFFAGIRELHNRRTEEPELRRVTFCLLGVATPSDLIRDIRTTPFNIGQRIELTDFTDAAAPQLARGMGRDTRVGEALVRRVLYWTGGHPYLTQRLCQRVAEDETIRDARGVDRLCEELFLSSRARERDDNLLFVRERILRSEVDRAGLLDLYAKARAGRKPPDDETDPLVSVLRLSGIVRAVDGHLRVRNRIYGHVFDKRWIIASMPDAEKRRQRAAYKRGVIRAAGVAAVILVAVAVLAAVAVGQRNRAFDEKRRADENFQKLQAKQSELERALNETKAQSEFAQAQRRFAEAQRMEADKQRQIAARGRQEAETERERAVVARKAAEAQRQIASARAREAEEQRMAADFNRQVAEQNEARAQELSKLSIDTLFNITRFLESANEKLRAVEYYEQLALIYRKAARKREESETLLNIGDVYIKLKQEPKAAAYFERSLGVFRGVAPEEEGRTHIKIGDIFNASGDRARARERYEQAVKLLRDALPALQTRKETSNRAANTLYYLSLAYAGMGDAPQALDYSKRALPLFKALGDAVMVDILDIRIEELTQTVKDTP